MSGKIDCRVDDDEKHELDVNYLLFHKGKLYSAGDDGRIKVWSLDLRMTAEVKAHQCSVLNLAASDDTLYSCSNEGTVKAWTLGDLKEKKTLLNDSDVEYWRIVFVNGTLYVGDNQGDVRIFKNETLYGVMNVAEPVKDMLLSNNLLFTVKDNDVVITDLHLTGEKIQFGCLGSTMGRAPLALLGNKLIFIDRSGKNIIVQEITAHSQLKELFQKKEAHPMIINSVKTAVWDGQAYLFSGGWDKTIKQWKLEDNSMAQKVSCNIEIVVNSIALGEKGSLYAAGGDGHIVRMSL